MTEPLRQTCRHPGGELSLYHQTLARLRELVRERTGSADLDDTVAAHAYLVSIKVLERGAEWEATVGEHARRILQRADDEMEAQRRELDTLRRVLSGVRGRILEVGAGWGRLASLYEELSLTAVYAEPSSLGTALLRQNGLRGGVRATGEALPLQDRSFPTAIMGWVLHHYTSGLDADRLLGELARVLAPAGLLFSIEPLSGRFSETTWMRLLASARFQIRTVLTYMDMEAPDGSAEHHAIAVCVRR